MQRIHCPLSAEGMRLATPYDEINNLLSEIGQLCRPDIEFVIC